MPESHFTGEVLEHSLGSVNISMMVKDADKVRKVTQMGHSSR